MKVMQLTTKIFGLLIFISSVNTTFAQQKQQVVTNTSFTCSSNAECKRKCEALGSDHTWKPNPGGSTFGTCTKRSQFLPNGFEVSSFPQNHGTFVRTEAKDSSRHKLKAKFILGLMKNKKWSKDTIAPPSVPLTILECESLGGTVQYHPGCSTTLLKCSNRGYAACITKTVLTTK